MGYLLVVAASSSPRRTDHNLVAEPAVPTPAGMDAHLADAARMHRYLWAAGLCSGKVVLDAGCGLGQGSTLIKQSGAREVVGVDSAAAVVEAARAQAPQGVRLEHADILSLPFEDGRFEVVVCFDVIEHADEPGDLLQALIRVMTDDGVLLVSLSAAEPTLAVSGGAGADLPTSIQTLLRSHFKSVAVYQQAEWLTTTVLDEEAFAAHQEVVKGELMTYSAAEASRGTARSTIMLATNGQEQPPHRTAVLAHASDAERWRELWDAQQAIISNQQRRIAELERATSNLSALRGRLIEAEQALSVSYLKQFTELREHIARLERDIESIKGSRSWRITAPLRLGGVVTRRLGKT